MLHIHPNARTTPAIRAEIATLLRETLEEFGVDENDVESVCAEFLKRRDIVVISPG